MLQAESPPQFDAYPVKEDPLAAYQGTLEDGTRIITATANGSYDQDFYRDGSTAAELAGRLDLTAVQFMNGVRHQATSVEPNTGAEPGRIHHQKPGVLFRHGLFTDYAASDTTPMFLMDAERLAGSARYRPVVEQNLASVELALGNILSHIGEDNLYWERPPQGATAFGLYVTSWRDSILPHADGKVEPAYPVVYPLVHFMAARSLLSASKVLRRPELGELADAMYRTGIAEFLRPDGYVTYRDQQGELVQPASDELQALAYIPRRYTHLLPIGALLQRARTLTTPLGFACTPSEVAEQLVDQYHGYTVWPPAQAKSHEGGTTHNIPYVKAVAGRIAVRGLNGHELIRFRHLPDGKMYAYPDGNSDQAWSVATREYFKRVVEFRAA